MDEEEQLEELACDVLTECRLSLMLRFRFLDLALWKMPFVSQQGEFRLSTDGKRLFYSPIATILSYQNLPADTIRDMLHLILHCIFRHPFDKRHDQAQAWSLACDIVVESIALEMCGHFYSTPLDEVRKQALKTINDLCGTLSIKELYRIFARTYQTQGEGGQQKRSRLLIEPETSLDYDEDPLAVWTHYFDSHIADPNLDEVARMRSAVNEIAQNGYLTKSDLYILEQLFIRDSHVRWQSELETALDTFSDSEDAPKKHDDTPKESQSESQKPPQEVANDPNMMNQTEEYPKEKDSLPHTVESQVQDSETQAFDESSQDSDELEHEWEEVSQKVELELLESMLTYDRKAGHLAELLSLSNRKKHNYPAFLRQFMTLNEVMRMSDDEFDYVYYTYGLSTYGNRPFVEALEYQESRTIRDFVIAIDTSESCSGELVYKFIEKTFDILKSGESLASRVNIHIVQCDAAIQNDMLIESDEDIQSFMDNFELRGFGGTDFRPVFAYVDKLIEDHEFKDLRGLIFFTDGYGIYPEKCPSYETAFVFMNDNYIAPKVPPWAMKVVLDEDDVRQF